MSPGNLQRRHGRRRHPPGRSGVSDLCNYREVDGGYEIRSAELAYFTDLETESVVDTWTNPYTNEILHVPVSSLPPTTSRIDSSLRIESGSAPTPGLTVSHGVGKPQFVGREVWFKESFMALRNAGASDAVFHYSESTVLRARLAELDPHRAAPVRCDTSYQSVSSWRGWMKMASRPGSMIGFGNGYYGASLDQLPTAWIKATEKLRPELLADPARILEANNQPVRPP